MMISRNVALAMVVTILALFALPLGAQMDSSDRFGARSFFASGFVPASATDLATDTVYVDAIVLINDTGSDVTVTVRDKSTDCGGSACPVLPSTSPLVVKAASIYSVPLYKFRARGGIRWSASAGSAVYAQIVGVR